MDFFDKIQILKDQISTLGTEDSQRILLNLESSQQTIVSKSIGQEFSSEELAQLNSTIEEASSLLPPSIKLTTEDWNGIVPPSLHLKNLPAILPFGPGGWGVPPGDVFSVRGKSYMDDDVKIASPSPLFHLRGVQMMRIETNAPLMKHIAMEPWSAFPKHTSDDEWLILNYLIPGQFNVQIVSYFTASAEALEVLRAAPPGGETDTLEGLVGWPRLLRMFYQTDKPTCDQKFKLIPSVVNTPTLPFTLLTAEGSWPIKMAVGKKPALIGTKLQLNYYRGKGYLEVDIDISSSSVASGILKLVRGAATSLVVDLGITLQGDSEEELPERLLCHCRYSCVDFRNAAAL